MLAVTMERGHLPLRGRQARVERGDLVRRQCERARARILSRLTAVLRARDR
jgi:hypothetical protein